MQIVSAAYKKAMRKPNRNRGYITARIGIISSIAQNNIVASEADNDFAYFANTTAAFKGNTVSQVYATLEENFTKVDGTMYFLPEQDDGYAYYNNGLVPDKIQGSVYINFDGNVADIKGLTIDFGEYYPTSFTVQSDNGTQTYENSSRNFVTEDTFDAISFLRITPLTMVNGQGRMRILEFTCGISNTFSNKQVKSFTYKDYVSTICESLPSQDMTLTVDNQNLYYNPDNPESAVAYMEQGQQMKVSFGYDLDGTRNIEWVPEITAFLKSWSATDTEAKFTMVDVFDWKLNGTYYRGLYRPEGISLYDLALDVLEDAGMKTDEYVVDPYLQNVKVYNPVPVVKHSEALQIISNAGRCVLSVDRQGRVWIKSSFLPDMYASAGIDLVYPSRFLYPGEDILPAGIKAANNETKFSHVENVLKQDQRIGYAIQISVSGYEYVVSEKTDWESSDRFNASDYNRIKGNLNFLHERAEQFYPNFGIIDMGADKGYADYPYAKEINNFEKNLETINKNVYTQNIGMTSTFYSNGAFIQWNELNRIESATLRIYEMLNRLEAGLPVLAFRLGNVKGVRT